MAERKVRKDKKYKFTREELSIAINEALIWASDGLSWHFVGQEEESNPLVMGSPKDLTFIIVEALTVGLPDSEDSSTSTTATS